MKDVFDKKDNISWISKIADIFAYVIKVIRPDWYIAANAASTLATASYDIYKDMKSKREAERNESLNESLNDLKNHLKKELKKIIQHHLHQHYPQYHHYLQYLQKLKDLE